MIHAICDFCGNDVDRTANLLSITPFQILHDTIQIINHMEIQTKQEVLLYAVNA